MPKHVALTREPNNRERAGMQIVAMRIAGMSEQEIAEALKLKRETLPGYVYLASKNGWLDLPTAREAVNYNLIPKAVKRLHEAMEAGNAMQMQSGLPVKTHVALKVAEGTIFKEFDKVPDMSNAPGIVAIKIEMPAGPVPQMRDETTGGAPAFIEAEVVR